MKHPQSPPAIPLNQVLALPSKKLGTILAEAVRSEAEGKYRHWDTIRHLTPPAGLTREQWWGATKLVRQPALKPLPLWDSEGKQFRYAITDMIARLLHEIDLGAGGNIGMPDPIANPQTRSQYVMHSLFQEAVTSSQLEGAASSGERNVAHRSTTSNSGREDDSEQLSDNAADRRMEGATSRRATHLRDTSNGYRRNAGRSRRSRASTSHR